MSTTSLAMIKYWRKALIDGASQTASLTRKDLGKGYVFSTAPQDGFLTGESREAWQAHLKEKKQDSSGLFIIPLLYGKKTAHGKTTCAESIDYVMPLYLSCTANIDGKLSVKDNTLPAIPRDILAPLEYLDKITIATIDEFDEALTSDIDKFLSLSFDDFLKNSLEILTKASPDFDAILNGAGFSKREGIAVLFEDSRDLFTINIRNLYDCLILDLKQPSPPHLPLLDAICAGKPNRKPLPDFKNSFSRRLGYANNKFYLAQNQRLAAACLLNLKEGEVLAVNGPPGTGKTSMLLSLIATEFVQAALDEAEHPPVIFAASTNNQAVTNILDDFEKIPSEEGIFQRWLPEINSFGSYYPSKIKIEEAAKQGRITEKFFETAQNQDYLKRARESFLDHLTNVSGQKMGLDAALKWLHEVLADKQQFLDKALEQYSHYELLKEELLSDDAAVLQAGLFAVVAKLRQFKEQWNTMWQNRSFFEKYFFWLPMFGRKLAMKKANIFEEYCPEYMGRKLFGVSLNDMPERAETFRIKLDKFIGAGNLFRDTIRQESGLELPNIPDFSILDADESLDAVTRRQLFWLSVHYWEGRWIKASEQQTQPPKPLSKADIWRMRMMLTPCAVATFHRLPSLLTLWEDQKLKPAYGLIDLLIAEESGQVSPEVAGPSFALAKRAVVVGDTLQIEPVWGISETIDRSDAQIAKLDPDELCATGHLASSGSVMRMAQSVTPFSSDLAPGLNPGLYLVEHRRCLEEIISYCNDLCYEGVLIPKTSGVPKTGLPPMYGLHVQGMAESKGGSRANIREATFIADWLSANKAMLRNAYGKELFEVVGIVTPFKAQATLIKKTLNNAGLNKPEITIGTVHSLQGAERQLIIFSPVYTKADSGTRLFFNQSANMLNVAVSRAKENFIVMGDMNLIAAVDHDTPYGQLFGRLEVRGNESPYFSLNDLPDHVRPNCWLAGTEQHDDFLRNLFQKSRRRLVISSPWIVEKVIEAFKNDINSSIEGGVAIHVITDVDNNLEAKGQRGIKLLESLGVHIHQVPKFHTKQLFCDDVLCADGSFNWLSASRSTTYQKVERTFVQASTECGDILKSLCEQCQLQI